MAAGVRAVVLVALTILAVFMMLFIASVSIEPLGEEVKTYDSVSNVNGGSTIDSIYDSVFKWSPLFLIGGMAVFGAALILFRERFVGQRPGGPPL